jgi:DNA-binding transcriptional MerR regulator
MSIGEITGSTGISVRTLHYYEEIGLLTPVERTAAGHRRYDHDSVVRLHKIRSLQQIGLSLAEIRDALDGSDLLEIIARHQERARTRLREAQELDRRLTGLRRAVASDRTVTTEEVLHTLAVMTFVDRHFDLDRAEAIGQRHQEIEASVWRAMVNDLMAEIARGVEPTDPSAIAVLERWEGTVSLLTRDATVTHRELLTMLCADEEIAHAHGLEADAVAWLDAVWNHHRPDGAG